MVLTIRSQVQTVMLTIGSHIQTVVLTGGSRTDSGIDFKESGKHCGACWGIGCSLWF